MCRSLTELRLSVKRLEIEYVSGSLLRSPPSLICAQQLIPWVSVDGRMQSTHVNAIWALICVSSLSTEVISHVVHFIANMSTFRVLVCF